MSSSPRGAVPRKPGKSIKEKRAIKKQKKAAVERPSIVELARNDSKPRST